MSSAPLYQEEVDSTFTHDGKLYDLNKLLLLSKDLPVQQVQVSLLRWILQYTSVDTQRVARADLSAPVLIVLWEKQLVVVDGAHRLTRAIELDREYIAGRFVHQQMLKHTALD